MARLPSPEGERKLAVSICENAGIRITFDKNCDQAVARRDQHNNASIILRIPTLENLDVWTMEAHHEISHLFPELQFTYDTLRLAKPPLEEPEHYIANLLCDNICERARHGLYMGRDLAILKGRRIIYESQDFLTKQAKVHLGIASLFQWDIENRLQWQGSLPMPDIPEGNERYMKAFEELQIDDRIHMAMQQESAEIFLKLIKDLVSIILDPQNCGQPQNGEGEQGEPGEGEGEQDGSSGTGNDEGDNSDSGDSESGSGDDESDDSGADSGDGESEEGEGDSSSSSSGELEGDDDSGDGSASTGDEGGSEEEQTTGTTEESGESSGGQESETPEEVGENSDSRGVGNDDGHGRGDEREGERVDPTTIEWILPEGFEELQTEAEEPQPPIASENTDKYIPHDITEVMIPNYTVKPQWEARITETLGNSTVSKQIQKYLKIMAQRHYAYGQKKGKLHGKNVHRLYSDVQEPRIFKQKMAARLMSDTAVSVAIDCSGSMINRMNGKKYITASACCVAISKTLTDLRIAHSITGFSEMYQLHEYLFKTFEQQITKERLIKGFSSTNVDHCYNADGESILRVAERLSLRPEKRKLMIVLSDGHPACCRTSQEYNGEWYLRHVCQTIEKSSMELVGIGICSDAVSRFYSNYEVLYDIEQLDNVLLTLLKKQLMGQ